jgi:hypothetical protein
MDLDEETLLPLDDDDTPTFTLFGRFLYEYAGLLLEFHNAMLAALEKDEATRYSLILKFDGEMRALGVEKVPRILSPCTPIKPAWPKWVKWAR